MRAVAAFVEAHPGLHMIKAARAVGPHHSLRFGYAAVHRAIAAGLVRAEPEKAGRMRLYPPRRYPDPAPLTEITFCPDCGTAVAHVDCTVCRRAEDARS
jgi:hypothetical protein